MKNINFTRGILLGVGLFGAATFMSSSASAAPGDRHEVKEDRKDVRDARKEVREDQRDLHKADTPAERRDALKDLREDKQDLRKEQHDLRDDHHDVHHSDFHNDHRSGYNNVFHPGNNDGFHPGNNFPNHPGNGIGLPNRPGFGNGSRSLEGRVVDNLKGNDFIIRTSNGQQVRVIVPSGEPGKLSRGDTVQVYGSYDGGTFRAQSAHITHNK